GPDAGEIRCGAFSDAGVSQIDGFRTWQGELPPALPDDLPAMIGRGTVDTFRGIGQQPAAWADGMDTAGLAHLRLMAVARCGRLGSFFMSPWGRVQAGSLLTIGMVVATRACRAFRRKSRAFLGVA